MTRPENGAPPDIYYDEKEVLKYTNLTRNRKVQKELSERAFELLNLPLIPSEEQVEKKQQEGEDESGSEDESDENESDENESDDESDDEDLKNSTDDEDEQDDSTDSTEEQDDTPSPAASPSHTCNFILDIGVGSGFCARVLEKKNQVWIGMDISSNMLALNSQNQQEGFLKGGDLVLADMGHGISFRAGVFDGAISISALQWLCYGYSSSQNPRARLLRLFSTLYSALKQGSRAVFQFYPENNSQIDLVLNASMKAGFSGGLVVDYPHSTKKKKYYLVLIAGSYFGALPKGKASEQDASMQGQQIKTQGSSTAALKQRKGSQKYVSSKDKAWLLNKKELMRKRGYENIPPDTKYSGRKRKTRF